MKVLEILKCWQSAYENGRVYMDPLFGWQGWFKDLIMETNRTIELLDKPSIYYCTRCREFVEDHCEVHGDEYLKSAEGE